MSDTVTIGTKIPSRMERMVEEIIKRDTHITKGELTRAALRDYIRRNYSDIFKEFTEEEVD